MTTAQELAQKWGPQDDMEGGAYAEFLADLLKLTATAYQQGYHTATTYDDNIVNRFLASPEAEEKLADAMAAHPDEIGMGHGASSCGTGCSVAVLNHWRNELFGEGSGTAATPAEPDEDNNYEANVRKVQNPYG